MQKKNRKKCSAKCISWKMVIQTKNRCKVNGNSVQELIHMNKSGVPATQNLLKSIVIVKHHA